MENTRHKNQQEAKNLSGCKIGIKFLDNDFVKKDVALRTFHGNQGACGMFSGSPIGKVHGKLKIVNAFANISSCFQNCIERFAFEKYTEFVERFKRMFDPAWIMVLFFLPTYGVFFNIHKIATSKHKKTHSALEIAGCSGWYLYNSNDK